MKKGFLFVALQDQNIYGQAMKTSGTAFKTAASEKLKKLIKK